MTNYERGLMWLGLSDKHRKLLERIPQGTALGQEIVVVRSRVRRLLQAYEPTSEDEIEQLEREHKIDQRLIRMLELLTRMVSVQNRVGNGTNEELDELSRKLLGRAELAAQRK